MNKMDIKKEFSSNKTLLLLVPGLEYNSLIVDVVRDLSDKDICYVTLNKTSDSLKDIFKKNKINAEKIVFIDGISKTIKKSPDQTEGCYFVSSPGALTELSLAINKFLKHKFDYVIFDSITNLEIYQKKAPVEKFLSSLINNIKETETKALFYALKTGEQDPLISKASMFVDKVIDLEKSGS